MPDVTAYDNQDDWMGACVPAKIDEGMEQDQAVAVCMSEWERKSITFSLDTLKAGARNSAMDMERLQSIHDLAVANGAVCAAVETVSIPIRSDDEIMFMGSEIKALGNGKVGGYLVRYSDQNTPDLTGEFFDADTYLGDPASVDVYYNHGIDPILRRTVIGKASLRKDPVGMWAEAQLAMRDEYEKQIYKLAEEGKLGWSSGSAGHLVEREPTEKATRITRWPIVEASLTPTPAEWRNQATPIKSLITTPDALAAADNKTAGKQSPAPKDTEVSNMDDEKLQAALESVAKSAAAEAVKAYAESQATVKAGTLTNVVDESDRAASGNPFKPGEFYKAVAMAALYPGNLDIRLNPLKATGANEMTPSAGGFLLPANERTPMRERMVQTGRILSLLNIDGISQGNGMTEYGLDETSRADGSRDGGVLAYWTAEAGTITSTKPKWREINLKLNDVVALIYATNDMLEDQNFLQGWISRKAPDALKFKVELATLFGDGVGKPRGPFGTSDAPHPAQKTFARETANAVTFADVVNMWAFRDASLNDYVWLINQSVEPQLISMVLATYNPVYLPPGGLSGAQYGSLFGRPVITTEYCPILGTQNDICLLSPSQLAAIDKPGIKADSSIHVAYVTNESAFRFVYRYDSQPTWYSTLTPFGGSSSDALSPYVSLTASS